MLLTQSLIQAAVQQDQPEEARSTALQMGRTVPIFAKDSEIDTSGQHTMLSTQLSASDPI
jgi:hypothetical protein